MSTLMDKFKEVEERVAELKRLVEIEESEEPDPYAEGDRRYDEQRDNETV